MMKGTTRWYLKPGDIETKDKIVDGLLYKGEMIDPSNPTEQIPVSGGKRLSMISVPEYFFIKYTEKSAANSGFDIIPYVREGNDPARIWKLDKRKKTARTKKVREVKKKIREDQLKKKK